MRFLVLSDLHGSAPAFKDAIQAFNHEQADSFIICGDFLYHGPRNNLPIGYDPKDLVPLLNDYKDKIIAVRGNCDAEVDQMLLQFPLMNDYTMLYNAGRRFFVTHGHLYDEQNLPPLSPGDVFISGHTHVPVLKKNDDGIIFLNPGSTTIPKSLSKPGYALIDDSHIELKTLENFNTIASLELN